MFRGFKDEYLPSAHSKYMYMIIEIEYVELGALKSTGRNK